MVEQRSGYETYTANQSVQARYLKAGEQVHTNQGTYTSDGNDVHVIYHDGREDIMAVSTFDTEYGEHDTTETTEPTVEPVSPVQEVGDDAKENENEAPPAGKKQGTKRS